MKGTSGALWSNPLFTTGSIRAGALSSWVLISPRMEILQPVWSPVPEFDTHTHTPHCEKLSSYVHECLILCLCTSEKCLDPASLRSPVRWHQTAIRPSFCLLFSQLNRSHLLSLSWYLVCLPLTSFVASSGLTH